LLDLRHEMGGSRDSSRARRIQAGKEGGSLANYSQRNGTGNEVGGGEVTWGE